MFNYNHLYYFYMTAKLGGITNAARHLRISQPSLSAQIRILENELNLELFQRQGRRLVLSDAGHHAFGYCRKIFEAADEFADFISRGDASQGNRITIGVADEIERPFVVELISALFDGSRGEKVPRVTMISGAHEQLTEALLERNIDGIITNNNIAERDVVVAYELLSPVYACGSRRLISQLNASKHESLASVLKRFQIGLTLPVIRNRLRQECDAFLIKNKVRNPVVFESDMLAAVVRATARGLGIGFFPMAYVFRDVSQGGLSIHKSDKPLWWHRIMFGVPIGKSKDTWVETLQSRFLELSKACEDMIAAIGSAHH
jgi:LysR family transcriptional activator of nhaA